MQEQQYIHQSLPIDLDPWIKPIQLSTIGQLNIKNQIYNDLWPWPISSRSFGLGLENRVRSVAYTVPDGFFPYLAQMITSMRRCVACNDLWPWPISSRSFDLDLENCVLSVASTVLDAVFLYLAQMITIIWECVACYVYFKIWKFEFLANFLNFSALTLKKQSAVLDGFFPYLAQMITSVRGCVAYNDLSPWPISSRSFGLGLENRVRSVASTVPDGFFPYFAQMITSMRRCVACDGIWPWPISSRSYDLVLIWDPTWFDSVGNHEAAGGILRTQAF